MPGPKPPEIVLTTEARTELERLARARTTPQSLVLRAQIVLLAGDGLSSSEAARRLRVDVSTVRQWRARWSARIEPSGTPLLARSVAECLADAPKPGRPARITPEQLCQIIALACELPADSNRPISHWSARELADEIIRRGILDRISARHAGRVLKRGGPQAPPDSLLAHATGR
jgi:putative transposase